jgi:hypothetical protein
MILFSPCMTYATSPPCYAARKCLIDKIIEAPLKPDGTLRQTAIPGKPLVAHEEKRAQAIYTRHSGVFKA